MMFNNEKCTEFPCGTFLSKLYFYFHDFIFICYFHDFIFYFHVSYIVQEEYLPHVQEEDLLLPQEEDLVSSI